MTEAVRRFVQDGWKCDVLGSYTSEFLNPLVRWQPAMPMSPLKCWAFIAVLALCSRTGQAQQCHTSYVVSPTPVMGNNDEIVKLADGSLWKVTYEYNYLYAYHPRVIVCPQFGKILVGETELDVMYLGDTQRRSGASQAFESRIDGSFDGWDGDTIVRLTNGQIWEQVDYQLEIAIRIMPEVIVFKEAGVFKMKVEGTRRAVTVERLK